MILRSLGCHERGGFCKAAALFCLIDCSVWTITSVFENERIVFFVNAFLPISFTQMVFLTKIKALPFSGSAEARLSSSSESNFVYHLLVTNVKGHRPAISNIRPGQLSHQETTPFV